MKHVIVLLIFVLSGMGANAQQLDPDIYGAPRQNGIYMELVGATYGLGITYERRLITDSTIQLNARIGVGSLIFVNAVPTLGLNANLGRSRHFFELGVNISRVFSIGILGGNGTYYTGQAVLGYRFQGTEGFLFRAGVATIFPVYDPEDWVTSGTVLPLPGVSFGYQF